MRFRFSSSSKYNYGYKWWCDYLEGSEEVDLNANTKVMIDSDGVLRFWLHGTNIVTLSPHNRYQYNSGLYYTLTTKRRMNQLGSIYIYQQDFEWYYNNEVGDKMEYEDFMIVDQHGRIFKEL